MAFEKWQFCVFCEFHFFFSSSWKPKTRKPSLINNFYLLSVFFGDEMAGVCKFFLQKIQKQEAAVVTKNCWAKNNFWGMDKVIGYPQKLSSFPMFFFFLVFFHIINFCWPNKMCFNFSLQFVLRSQPQELSFGKPKCLNLSFQSFGPQQKKIPEHIFTWPHDLALFTIKFGRWKNNIGAALTSRRHFFLWFFFFDFLACLS